MRLIPAESCFLLNCTLSICAVQPARNLRVFLTSAIDVFGRIVAQWLKLARSLL